MSATVTIERDLLGPRYVFEWYSDADERCWFELYAGEWASLYSSMGDDCCWHDYRRTAHVRDVVAMALGASAPFTVSEVAGAHLASADLLGGRKAGAMRRSLSATLARHGLQVKS